MKNKHHFGLLEAIAIGMATALGGAQQVNALQPIAIHSNQPQPKQRQQNKKEAIPVRQLTIAPVSIRNDWGGFSGDRNPYKHHRKGQMNQRQKRKWLRQNPHMRRYA